MHEIARLRQNDARNDEHNGCAERKRNFEPIRFEASGPSDGSNDAEILKPHNSTQRFK
jgi:hypothetical protein